MIFEVRAMSKMKKSISKYRWLFKISILGLLGLCLFLLFTNLAIKFYSAKYVFDNIEELGHHKVGLVLGTSKKVTSGRLNNYFAYRIKAAVDLFKAGKIDYILVSGDNATIYYNEPQDMLEALVEAGVPKDRIVLDYAGFRTLDSIIRCKEVFMQENFVIISQEFHNERAVFLAHAHGINATGYNAQDVSTQYGFFTQLREVFARSKVFIDLALDKRPKFLGEQIHIGE